MALIQSSLDGKQLTGYQLLALGQVASQFRSGIVPKAGQEFLVSYDGLNFNIGSGILIDSGMIIQNDMQVRDIPLETNNVSGTKYLVVENNRGSGESEFKFTTSLITSNLVQNPQGISQFVLAIVSHSSTDVTGVKQNNQLLTQNGIVVLSEKTVASGNKVVLSESIRNFKIIRLTVGDVNHIIDCPVTQYCTRLQGMTGYSASNYQRIDSVVLQVNDSEGKDLTFTSTRMTHTSSSNHGASSTLSLIKVEGLY